MKKNRSILFIILIALVFILGISNVYADDISDAEDMDLSRVSVGDKFRVEVDNGYDIYEVNEVEKDYIYIGSINKRNKLNIYHFEIDAYEEGDNSPYTSRKFVKLKDLCNETYIENDEIINICKATSYKSNRTGTTINIQRQYVNNIMDTEKKIKDGTVTYEQLEREVYYSTDHELGTNEFRSLLYVNNGKGSTIDDEYDYDENNGEFYYFGDISRDEVNNERFDRNGVLTGDVETLIDKNNDIYISIRFLSEALGARVDWLEGQVNNETDAVLIRFYDSESYCKELDVNFNETNKDFEGMYSEFVNALKGKENDMSFDLSYTYRNKEQTKRGTAKWNKLFLGGYAAEKGYVYWDFDKKKVVFEYTASKSEETQDIDFQEICPSKNYDSNGQLETLDGCIEIMGLVKYYGVPVPINLLRQENDTCKFDDDHFEDDDNYYDNDNYYEYEEMTYFIGDIHVSKMKNTYHHDDIEFIIASKYNNLESALNRVNNKFEEDKNYNIIINIGNTEIDEKRTLEEINNGSTSNVSNYLKQLANDYARVYNDFYEDILDNNIDANVYIVKNMPIENDSNYKFVDEFWSYLTNKIDNDINIIDIDNIEFEYVADGLTYTDKTYESIFNEIMYQID